MSLIADYLCSAFNFLSLHGGGLSHQGPTLYQSINVQFVKCETVDGPHWYAACEKYDFDWVLKLSGRLK